MVQGLVLAAGRGSRLENLTDDRPKCMVELNGRTLFSRQITALQGAGIDKIAVVAGYRSEVFSKSGFPLILNENWETTGIFTSLLQARRWLADGDTIVSYSDIFYDSKIVRDLASSDADVAIAYDPKWIELWGQRFEDPKVDGETFVLDGNNVKEIGKKIVDLDTVEGQYMGLFKFSRIGWAKIEEHLSSMTKERLRTIDMTSLFQSLVDAGIQVRAVANAGVWGEVDNKQDLRLYEKIFPTL